MRNRDFTVGVFLIAGVVLFSAGIFLIGSQHKTFSRNFELYTEFADLNGLMNGAKVQVAGSGAGEVTEILVPESPGARFRIRLRIDERFHSIVRADSVATVSTEGVIGDKIVQIRPGSARIQEALPGSTLPDGVGLDLNQMMEKSARLLDETSATLQTTGQKLNGTLDVATTAVRNANDVIVGLKEGKGTAGMLLRDEETATRIRQTVASIQDTANSLNHTAKQADELVSDLNAHQLPQKADEILAVTRDATENVRATTGQIRQSVSATLGPNAQGTDTATNLRETIANLNQATENIVEDTEAAKHNILLRGYFKRQGYFNLTRLSADEYRKNKLFSAPQNHREWLSGSNLFASDAGHAEVLSTAGKAQIDGVVTSLAGSSGASPLIVEGYAANGTAADSMSVARARTLLVRQYIRDRFRLDGQIIAVVALGSEPPAGLGRDRWDGICVLTLSGGRH